MTPTLSREMLPVAQAGRNGVKPYQSSFPISYTWAKGTQKGGTAGSGVSQQDAEARFARLHPHVEVVSLVRPIGQEVGL